jgi:hypothetical protein
MVVNYLRDLCRAAIDGWNRFWFTPSSPETLCAIRVLTGLMLVYTHLVWSLDLEGFFGEQGRLSTEFVAAYHNVSHGDAAWLAWSHLFRIQSSTGLWFAHLVAMAVLLLFTLGLFTRVTSALAYLITVSYAHRATGALFGLDQINSLLAMYLVLGPAGDCYSLDRWWSARHNRLKELRPRVSVTIAIRLIQLHLCIIYLFAGLGKLFGATWWDGTALWEAFANYEYQTLDMTWLAWHPLVVNALCQFTVAWEVAYVALVWPKWTRPLVLAAAVPLHLGIAFCMGMITFGLVMLIANLSFVSPQITRDVVRSCRRRRIDTSQSRSRHG